MRNRLLQKEPMTKKSKNTIYTSFLSVHPQLPPDVSKQSFFAHLMCCIERPARFISPAEAVHGGTGYLKKSDVMLFVSKNTIYTSFLSVHPQLPPDVSKQSFHFENLFPLSMLPEAHGISHKQRWCW